MEIVKVTWEDAWSNSQNNWTAESLAREPGMLLMSVGWLLLDNERGIDIATEHNPDGKDFRKVQHIPRANVREVVKFDGG